MTNTQNHARSPRTSPESLFSRAWCMPTALRLAALAVLACATLPAVACAEMAGVARGTGHGDVGDALEASDRANKAEITYENEYYYGRGVSAMLFASYGAPDYRALDRAPDSDKAQAILYLNTLGSMIAEVSDQPNTFDGWHFGLLETDSVCAFSAPGGFCHVSLGLLRLCDTEDELAAVLAHEIGHVCAKHGAQAMKDEFNKQAEQAWLKVGSNAATEVAPDQLKAVAQGFGAAIAKGLDEMYDGYSRDKEFEADRLGLTYLARAGFDPRAAVTILEKLDEHQRAMRGDAPRGDFAKTHPEPVDRIAKINAYINKHNLRGSTSATRTSRFNGYSAMLGAD